MVSETLREKIRGVVFGQAVGDALGLSTEFMSREEVSKNYPAGVQCYADILQDPHRRRWRAGDWTDDTDQMLCILDSLLEKNEVDIRDIALRLYRWVKSGGKGVGFTVYGVTNQDDFLSDPHGASRRVWERTERIAAANGSVMRTSILGVWNWSKPESVRRNAEDVSMITHYDPRCVGSCVGVCLAISEMLCEERSVQDIINRSLAAAVEYDSRIAEIIEAVRSDNLGALNLDHEEHMGYTLKTFGAAFWALQNASSFRSGITEIVMQGGDADTNAAVAGALLGARYGFLAIPEEWIMGLKDRHELELRVSELLNTEAACLR